MQHGLLPVTVFEDHRGLPVNTGFSHAGRCPDADRRPEDVEGERDGVDAQVQERSAAQRRVVEAVRRILGQILVVVRDHCPDLAQGTGPNQLTDADHVRKVAGPHGLKCDQSLRLGELHNLPGLPGVHGEGLFNQHVFAGVQGQQRILVVERVRRRNVDNIDVRVSHEVLVASMGRGDLKPGRELRRRCQGPGAHGLDH